MISNDARDPMLQALAHLHQAAPDPARAERVRAQCRARLGRARRSDRAATIVAFARILAPVVVGCVYRTTRMAVTIAARFPSRSAVSSIP